MLITRAGPHNYQPCADGARRRHEKLGKWICNGVADLICVRENKVRERKEPRHSRWKPPMSTKPVWQSWKMSPCPKCFVITRALNCSIVNSSLLEGLGSTSLSWARGWWGEEKTVVTCFWSHCKVNQLPHSVVWALQSTSILVTVCRIKPVCKLS